MTIENIHHVALSVGDLERSATWYHDLFGFEELFRESNDVRSAIVMGIPDTDVVVGLVQFPDRADDAFTPKRAGLDHLCFAADDRAELERWAENLEQRGIAHSGVVDLPTSSFLNFKDPDGIALAFATPLRQRSAAG
jgi:glyoxylase I family protein